MPHSRARKRRRLRERNAKIAEIEAELGEDAGYYAGDDCSCGKPLFFWAVPNDISDPERIHWPFIPPRYERRRRLVVAGSARDARAALAGKHVEHDAFVETGNQYIPRLAHDQPSGTVLIADFGSNGTYGEGLRDLVLNELFTECQVIQSVAKLEERLWYLLPGDYFIGKLCEMKAGGCYSDAEAVEFIEELEDRLLPKGARAILDATSIYSQALNDTIELCLGRIQLVHSATSEQMHDLVTAMRAE